MTPLPANTGEASQAHRLDALHRMSGEITHDLNNLLGVILSANERLAEELGDGGEQQKLALLSLEAAERAAELLRRALTLTQAPAAPQPDAIDGAEALGTLERLAGQAMGPGVRLRIFASALPLLCLGDRTGLEMALLNLCLNADQAMPGGGRIFVQARRMLVSETESRRLGVTPGLFIAFTVRDTGPGMSAETLARATDPLFTTKATGTGLGLSSVLDFVTSCGGAFALQSREGLGTAATLYLPAAASADQDAVAA
ncbi:MAG TPA: ATP-binding protein [Phenylobacterium sp.]|nr:ATP-binding protein [Phenylobacterium sp.]